MSRRYDHLAQVQNPPTTGNDFERSGKEWSAGWFAWVGLEPLYGDELVHASQVHARVTHKVYAHWDQRYSTKQRLVLEDGRKLHIRSVQNVREANRTAVLICREMR